MDENLLKSYLEKRNKFSRRCKNLKGLGAVLREGTTLDKLYMEAHDEYCGFLKNCTPEEVWEILGGIED